MNVDSFAYHSFELYASNMFSPLSRSNITIASDINTSVFCPVHTSSLDIPKRNRGDETNSNTSSMHSTQSTSSNVLKIPPKSNLRIMTVNLRSVVDSKAELAACIDYTKPNIICRTESWHKGIQPGKPTRKDAIKSSEVFPKNFKIYRNDTGTRGVGVFVGIHEDLISTENTSIITECEIEWSKVKLKNNKDLHIASFYMPHRNMKDLDNLRLSLDKLTNGKPKHVIIAGDFNCPDIEWATMEIKTGASDREVQLALLDITSEYGLTQIHDKPTREGNMLDLAFTNNPSLIKTSGNAPGISDHDIVITDSMIKPHYCNQQPQKRYIFSKANWDINNNINSKDINYSWNRLKHCILSTVGQNVPSKIIKKKYHIP
jgi:hypothetical protein